MIRNSWWMALGVSAIVGCSTGPNTDVNNTIPQNPNAPASKGPPAPNASSKGEMPADYPAPKSQEAKNEEGKAEELKTDKPKPEGSTPVEPKSAAPKADESKGDAPKADAPK